MATTWRFHVSLNVADLKRSVAFYQRLLDLAPAKCHDDYAKFEVLDPAVVFSLTPHALGAEARAARLGLQLASMAALNALRRRCAERGIAQEDATNEVFRVMDPDGNSWCFSTGPGHWAMAGGPVGNPSLPVQAAPSGPVVWEHYVTTALPGQIPHADATVDEVRLTGTFNANGSDADRAQVVAEAFRVLKTGGKIVVHALAADKPLSGPMPQLPGLAAMVARVPVQTDMVDALQRAGFIGMQFVKYSDKAWFQHKDVGMREVKLVGWKTLPALTGKIREVIYRGPMAALEDGGQVFPRGGRVAVSEEMLAFLRAGPLAGQFVFLEPTPQGATCQIH